jgi:hypothetical protein
MTRSNRVFLINVDLYRGQEQRVNFDLNSPAFRTAMKRRFVRWTGQEHDQNRRLIFTEREDFEVSESIQKVRFSNPLLLKSHLANIPVPS